MKENQTAASLALLLLSACLLCQSAGLSQNEILSDAIASALRKQEVQSQLQLIEAVVSGDAGRVRALLAEGVQVNATNQVGFTGLMLAAFQAKEHIVDILLAEGADPNLEAPDRLTALCLAAGGGSPKIIKSLLKAGARLDAKDVDGWTPIVTAALAGKVNNVNALSDAGASLTMDLVCASALGLLDQVKTLSRTMDINAKNDFGRTPLAAAAVSGQVEAVKFLLSKGANPDSEGLARSVTSSGPRSVTWTAVNLAAARGYLGVVKALAEKGANLDKKTSEGRTPLINALGYHNQEVVQFLLKKKANPNQKDPDGFPALNIAAMTRQSASMKSLIEGGADINAVDNKGWTALMVSAANGDELSTAMLLSAGAKVGLKHKDSNLTALQLAQRNGHENIVELFQNPGAASALTAKPAAPEIKPSLPVGHPPARTSALRSAAAAGAPETRASAKEEARYKLAALNLNYSPEGFVAAAMDGDTTAVKLFLDAGMDPNTINLVGNTALCAANASGGHLPIVNMLLERGANPNLAMKGPGALAGMTPLMMAAVGQHIDIMKALLEKGSNPDATSDTGVTVLMLAVGKGNHAAVEVVKILLPHVKNINAKDKDGRTAFDGALGQENADLLLLVLREAGAITLTEEVVGSFCRVLAGKVASSFIAAAASQGNKESVLSTLTNGLTELKNRGFSEQQMRVARKAVAERVENETKGLFYRRSTLKTDEDKRCDKFLAEFYPQLLAQLDPFNAGKWVGQDDGHMAFNGGRGMASDDELDRAARRVTAGIKFDAADGRDDWIRGYKAGYGLGWDRARGK